MMNFGMKQLCLGSDEVRKKPRAEVWNKTIFIIRIYVKKPSAGMAEQNCTTVMD